MRSVLLKLPNGRLIFVGGAKTWVAAVALTERTLSKEGLPLRTLKRRASINKDGAYVVQAILPPWVRMGSDY